MDQEKLNDACAILGDLAAEQTLTAASLLIQAPGGVLSKSFGQAHSADDVFLLASITKPIVAAAVMSLWEQGHFQLEDPVKKFIPEFTGDGRDDVTLQHLLTHTSGLPERLPGDHELRAAHAQLGQFTEAAINTSLRFTPGTQYQYSSPAFLLAGEVAQRASGLPIADLVQQSVYQPLSMQHSALGMGGLDPGSLMTCQVQQQSDWDGNSPYWRHLGAPWSGAHGSVADIARFLAAFLDTDRSMLRAETIQLMISNQNPAGIRRRGLGFDLGATLFGPSEETFGHGGVTGTLCWADPVSQSIFVLLTTLPISAADPHPREVVSRAVSGLL